MSSWQYPFPDKYLREHFGTLSEARKKLGLGPHRGTDWSNGLKAGTQIPAITNGTIKLIQYSKILGWVVVQSASVDGKTYFIGYCHLYCAEHGANCKGGHDTPLTDLKVGDRIKVGQKTSIKLGNSGSASSGAHLHATLSNTVKGVFAGTVYDLYKFITKQLAKTPKPATSKETKTATKTAKIEKCPTCGKAL